MARALALAKKGIGRVHPNPLVGAVLARGSRILAEGAHERYGGSHAEAVVFSKAKGNLSEATLYVTLEPCAHFGKTPPCADAILRRRIGRVVVGSRDPNPLVAGKGIAALRRAGVPVTEGVRAAECDELNEDFFHWIRIGTPFVSGKIALSADGRITTPGSRWITGPAARRHAHGLRSRCDAILVGADTVLKDDPLLTVRSKGYRGRQPVKVVLDGRLRVGPRSKIFSRRSPAPVWIVTASDVSRSRLRLFGPRVDFLKFPRTQNGRVRWSSLLAELGRRGIVRLLVEGGAKTLSEALKQKALNELYIYRAPRKAGQAGLPGPFRRQPSLKAQKVLRLGADRLTVGRF